MNAKWQAALLELGIIGGISLALVCVAEATRRKVMREHAWDVAVITEAGRVSASAED